MPGRLPELSELSALRLINEFAPGSIVKGHKITGVNRDGRPFVIELEHSGKMRPDIVQKAIRYLGLTRDEFWEWHSRR